MEALLPESLLLPPLEDEEVDEDLADFVSDVLPVVLVPDLAFVPEVLDSDEADLPLLLEDEALPPSEAELPALPWFDELISEPL
jgi:hypothetical protein